MAEQHWITGECWLYCGRAHVPVMWLGSVQWLGQHAPLYACAPCVRSLNARVRAHLYTKDHHRGGHAALHTGKAAG